MGSRQHELIAKLVANQIGIDDPTILCLASVYPDARNDPEFAGDIRSESIPRCRIASSIIGLTLSGHGYFRQVRDPRDRLRKHHDPERSKDVYRWLGEARGYHLRGNDYSRDRVLGIALHYIADAYSPFGGGDDDHDEFERQVGRYAKRTLSSDLDQTYSIEAHSAPAYILNNLHKGPSKGSVQRRFVQVSVPAEVKNQDVPMEERKAIAKKLSPFDDVQEDDFVVVVVLGELTERPDFFVVPTREVEKWVQERWADWVDTPGAKGQQRSLTNRQRHLGTDYACEYEPYRDAWEQLWEAAPDTRS